MKPSEAGYWKDITADMMSEEEKEDSGFIRHPPKYRSNNFNKFLKKLDDRYERRIKSSNQPRLPRKLGSPREKDVPIYTKMWLIKPELRTKNADPATENEGDISADEEHHSDSDSP